MQNNETLVIGDMTYTATLVSTWVTLSGKCITTGRINAFNAKTGHGWSGELSSVEWQDLKGKQNA